MRLHDIAWTEDRRLNGYLLLTTVPIGEAVTQLPFKTDRKVVNIVMPLLDSRIEVVEDPTCLTENFCSGHFERRRVVNEHGEEMIVWVRVT